MHLHCASFQTLREPGSFVTLLSNLEPKVKLPVPPTPRIPTPQFPVPTFAWFLQV